MTRSAALPGSADGARRAACCAILLTLTIAAASLRAASAADRVREGRATLTVEWVGATADLGQSGLLDWVRRSAAIVGGYYGDFPAEMAAIRVTTVDGEHVGAGHAFGSTPPHIEISVGRHVTVDALRDDWVLVHEMIHLALPEVGDEQNWLGEGLATYVEGIARVQAGNMSEAALWQEYLESMPKGLPQGDDRGLDRTHSWARTYWGGALYCLIADVRIREQTANRKGLQDALRAISQRAGLWTQWPVQRIFATGDTATGTTVLHDLYMQMKDQPMAPDLGALWVDLGIRMNGGVMHFDDSARLAAVRRAITRRAAEPSSLPSVAPQ